MTIRDVALMLHAAIERERAQWRHTMTATAASHNTFNEKPKKPSQLMPWAFGEEGRKPSPEEILSML